MNNSLWAIAAISCVAMICTTIAGVMVEGPTAAAIIAGIAAIATPVIMGLLNQAKVDEHAAQSAVQCSQLESKIDDATERIPAKVAENVAEKVREAEAK